MIRTLAVSGYRSLRDLVLPLAPLTVVTGANGTGKSSLYRAFRLLAATADQGVVRALAAEGGLGSVLWAGPEMISGAMRRGEAAVEGSRRKGPVALQLGFASPELAYRIDLGLPQTLPGGAGAFVRDPEIKREAIFGGPVPRPAAALVKRGNQGTLVRDGRDWRDLGRLDVRTSILDEFADPEAYPEVRAVRREVRGWRFYDALRTDADAPARRSFPGTWTPVLAADGSDVAAALLTIQHSDRAADLAAGVAAAFDGASLEVDASQPAFALRLRQPGLLRPLEAAELSDGTLRYLLLAAALLSPRPPGLLVLNEPETSLHPGVLPALGAMIAAAAKRCQVVVVTHAGPLVDALGDAGAQRHDLVKELGETRVDGLGLFERPAWDWGRR